ncbi:MULTISPECIES: hydroxymethylbilane synthase [Brevibacillus]|jgi:hydroxymethylbilane synthase|uniref:Porphobilinogen deaminase n=1 Tax=Brevibacillus aydinogluensis TaxID=927786 RepID=A0AA48M8Y9_9BACL|nr:MULTISPECIES: hydroxymethylbilane synthase [Brevibacillus]REK63263.1 MAG: hydroxymethylbilane synthase [Brevibacillus sp.]MBR8660805.1 hydroxymethylbilane synthase [Brevibacillus sp. NL20B1]MDT3414332.1 hydroxymethylbilane synthase [Brevibacillus aydinogluensis]NNV03405.1 hydroxymethylbilane synthase [Brevibacillus sp. MCWH]CAJ1003448.1 hydroxymethylbilane synthase [Brevibacillus aydinogluensis]
MRNWKVGTRRSMLALTQTNWVVDQLKRLAPEASFELHEIVTKGDRILDVTLSKVGGKGLFVKEIEQSLLDKETDLAVHSLKDMPAELPEGLVIGAIPKRVDPRDVLLSKDGKTLDELPHGALVGTSSLRRSAQLLAYRPDIQIESLRGNIDTRIRKLNEGNFDAIILAAAGLERVKWDGTISQYLPVEISVPAVGQGALAIECRADDEETLALLRRLDDPPTRLAVTAERSFLHRLQGGCQVPIGAYATVAEAPGDAAPTVTLTGLVASPDGKRVFKRTVSGTDPDALGRELADTLLAEGAGEVLAEVQKENLG